MEKIYTTEEAAQCIVKALGDSPLVILSGPAGVGKTYLANALVEASTIQPLTVIDEGSGDALPSKAPGTKTLLVREEPPEGFQDIPTMRLSCEGNLGVRSVSDNAGNVVCTYSFSRGYETTGGCWICRFWRQVDVYPDEDGVQTGCCHRFPPICAPEDYHSTDRGWGERDRASRMFVFPTTLGSNHCGEFKE